MPLTEVKKKEFVEELLKPQGIELKTTLVAVKEEGQFNENLLEREEAQKLVDEGEAIALSEGVIELLPQVDEDIVEIKPEDKERFTRARILRAFIGEVKKLMSEGWKINKGRTFLHTKGKQISTKEILLEVAEEIVENN